MRSNVRVAVAVLCLVLTVGMPGCGGGSSSPSTPTVAATPTPAVNVAGVWNGSYRTSSCGHTGVFATLDFCSSINNQLLVMRLTLAQSRSPVPSIALAACCSQARGRATP